MKSSVIGKNTSFVEVINISAHGVWILIREREYYLPYDVFPWFKSAKISDILDVRLEHDEYLFWPTLNIDLELESIKHPDSFPLRYT
jgi:hypothetical protein